MRGVSLETTAYNDAGYFTGTRALKLLSTNLHCTVVDLTTTNTLTQVFYNSAFVGQNECVYTFPLYESAAVTSFTAQINARTIHGIVQEKKQARKTFEDAKAAGKSTALLTDDADDVWTASVGNIPAGGVAAIVIKYVYELKMDMESDNAVRLVVPSVIAPRYGDLPPGIDISAARTQLEQFNTSVNFADGVAVVVDVRMAGTIKSLQSPSHPITIKIGAHHDDPEVAEYDACKASGALFQQSLTSLNKDFVFIISAADLDKPRAFVGPDPVERDTENLLVSLVPPFFALPPQMPEVVFLIDRSGSMCGERIASVKSALCIFLASLPQGINFNICSFGSDFSFLFPQSYPYNAETLKIAQDHVNGMDSNYGGTVILQPIQETYKKRLPNSNLEVLFLTDGEVYDNDRSIAKFVETTVQDGTVRYFTLGIGSTVTLSIVEGISRAGRGYSQNVQPGERANRKMIRMLQAALTPHVNDWSINWDGKPTSGVLQAPIHIPSLFPGSRSSVYLTFPGPNTPETVILAGTVPITGEQVRITINVQKLSEPSTNIRHICGLLHLQDLSEGRIPDADVEMEGTATGVRFGLASRWTSFVAVDNSKIVYPIGIGRVLAPHVQATDARPFGSIIRCSTAVRFTRHRLQPTRSSHSTNYSGTVTARLSGVSNLESFQLCIDNPPANFPKSTIRIPDTYDSIDTYHSTSLKPSFDANDSGSVLAALGREQEFDGAFKFSAVVLAVLEIRESDVADKMGEDQVLWATIMVCLFLAVKLEKEKEEWEMMVAKAWRVVDEALGGREMGAVEAEARKVLGF